MYKDNTTDNILAKNPILDILLLIFFTLTTSFFTFTYKLVF